MEDLREWGMWGFKKSLPPDPPIHVNIGVYECFFGMKEKKNNLIIKLSNMFRQDIPNLQLQLLELLSNIKKMFSNPQVSLLCSFYMELQPNTLIVLERYCRLFYLCRKEKRILIRDSLLLSTIHY